MKNLKNFSVILVAAMGVLVGVIYVAPNLVYQIEMGKEYRGVALTNAQDEWSYLGMIREVMDGNFSLKNWYFWEQKQPGEPASYMSSQFLPCWLVGIPAKIMSIPMDTLVIIIKFLFPALLFIFLYILLFYLVKDRAMAVLGALAALLMPVIWTRDFAIFNWSIYWDFHLVFLRPGIQVAALFWVFSLIFWIISIQNDKAWSSILGAFALSATVYSYLFYWTYLYAALTIFVLAAVVFKNRVWFKHTLIMLLGSTVLSAYAWFRLIQTASHSNIWTSHTFGVALPHAPAITLFQVLVVTVIFACFWIYRKGWLGKTEFAIMTALASAHIICMNQQVITGISLELHHYEIFVTPVIFTIIITVVFSRLNNNDFRAYMKDGCRHLFSAGNKRCYVYLAAIALIALTVGALIAIRFPAPGTGGILGKIGRLAWMIDKKLITWVIGSAVLGLGISKGRWSQLRYSLGLSAILIIGLLTQISSYAGTRKGFATVMQDYGPAFSWLNGHTAAESVVFCNPLTADFTVVYTHNNVYFADYAMFTRPEIFQDRALRLFDFIGLSPDQLRSALKATSADYSEEVKSIFFYWRPYGEKNKIMMDRDRFLKCYSDTDIDSAITRYQKLQSDDMRSMLEKYRVDYLVYGPIEGSGDSALGLWKFQRKISELAFLRNVFNDGRVMIYAVE